VRGFGAFETGLAFMPLTLAVAVLSTGVTARLLARFGAMRVMVPGLLLVAASLLLLATAGPHSGYFPRVAVSFLLFGVGSGTAFIPLLSIAMAKVPKEDAGIASGIVNVSMQISAAIGLALLATISTDRAQTLASRGDPLATALTGGYHLAFLAAAGCVAIGIVLALVLLREHAPGPAEA
jgi:MFS family permease